MKYIPPTDLPDLIGPESSGDDGTLEVIVSGDPNEKLGPDGFDPGGLPSNPRFIRGDGPLGYTIYFENVPSASAPAQEVVITDTVDASLDAGSVVLGEIAFGDYVVGDLLGQASGTATVPLKNSPYLVDVTVENNAGVLTWTLRTIDPLTGDLPIDATAGFLPPNDAAGSGEGRISFTVQPVGGATTGTAISNAASIVFDTNAPIVTKAWVNTIDNEPPASTVDAIAAASDGQPNDRLVSWSGDDGVGGAGLSSYTVYVSENGGSYTALQSDTTATSASWPVACSRTYRFYSTARDFVGLLEAPPGGGPDLVYQAGPDLDFDTVCDDFDNCLDLPNASQADVDGDGVGDACDDNPALTVSSDPGDGSDFATIQEAVDAVTQTGTLIRILPGLGYTGTVVVDRGESISFTGEPGGTAVVIDGGAGAAFDLRTSGAGAMEFSDLTITGQDGILSAVPVEVRRVRFDQVAGTALRTSSAATLSNVIIGASGGGVRLETGGSLLMEYATIAGNTGVGVDNAGLGAVSIAASIIHGNGGGDLINVGCDVVSFSDTALPDCSAQNGNIAAPPALLADFHLDPASPCIDAGPAPASYAGTPSGDLDGNPRLRDYDGDGLAHSDMGAFEEENAALTPGEVSGLMWTSGALLTWDVEPDAIEYHLYRWTLPVSYGGFASCNDAADPVRTDTEATEALDPAAGEAWIYLVTGENGSGEEGTLGFATGAERSNFTPCP